MTNKTNLHHGCRAMFEKISEFIDNELDAAACREIEMHAESCARCKACLETLKRTIDFCKKLESKPIPETFSRRLKDAVEELTGTQHLNLA